MYNSNDIAKRIKQVAKIRHIKTTDMFESIGLGKNTLTNFKTSMPKADNLAKIADYLNCSVDYLLGRTDIQNIYIHPVNSKGGNVSLPPMEKTIILPFYRTPSSAGSGSMLFDEIPVEYMNVPKTIETSDADFMIEVRGDSMIPKFSDGDIILVKQSESIYENEIGVFILNGESFVKKMGKGCLISLNSAYAPIELREFDTVRCAGKVIGIANLN